MVDRFTKNPDSVTSCFTGMLCISMTPIAGFREGKGNFMGSMIGTFWGLLIPLLFNGFHFGATTISQPWWVLVVRIPVAVMITCYTMFFLNNNIGALTNAYFSAVYVGLVQYKWQYLPSWINDDYIVVSTIIVRVLAITTAVVLAVFVNALLSGPLMHFMFRSRLRRIEKVISDTINSVDENPYGDDIQEIFHELTCLLKDLSVAEGELFARSCFRGDDHDFYDIGNKSRTLLHLVSAQFFLAQLSELQDLTVEERNGLKILLQYSKDKQNAVHKIQKHREQIPESVSLILRMILYHETALLHEEELLPDSESNLV